MHPINPPVREVRLIHQDGRRWYYKSLHDAFQALGSSFLRTYVGRDFLVAQKGLRYDWRAQYYYPVQQLYAYDYILRDQWGVALTPADFTEAEWAARRRCRPSGHQSFSGRKVPAGRHQYRSARKGNLVRSGRAEVDEGEPLPRPARRFKWLGFQFPARRSSRRDRSWKTQSKRTHQWREAP